jgi:7-cyano-7-deazaguanine synthase
LHCERLGIPHKIIRLPFFRELFHSSLLEGAEAIPEGDYKEENMRSTVVPFRNGIMLSIAAGVAENEKLPYIMLANHGGDHTIYPDCRADFVEAMNKAVHFGTWNGVQLLTPYTHLSKAEIALHGKEIGIDYSETWSCYKGKEFHCGVCGTCRERIEALTQAGIEDNTIYKQ